MRNKYLVTVIVTGIILIAMLTNPGLNRHKEAIKNKLDSYMQKEINGSQDETDNKREQSAEKLGMSLGGVITDALTDKLVSSDNYFLFSTTKLNWNGGARVVGLGLFGNVFITRELKDVLSESVPQNQNH
ncbi:MAG: DUF4359 domain-containing protein [Bacteroidia bacterium]|nr:DUF4359 domain-containing protein [Bacteroidia bacterium]MCZ2276809.1 DUF4359 domain-containing protein [Bacteroidia bacterium]